MKGIFSKISLSLAITACVWLASLTQVSAATFEFSPSTGSAQAGNCRNQVILYVDASGESSNTADLILHYNPAQVQILDDNPDQNGVQVKPGSAYQAYVANMVNPGAGEIRLTALSLDNYLTSRRVFATLDFNVIGTPGSVTFDIQFDGIGNTLDSNVADDTTNLDLLTGVTDGTYTVVAGNCTADTEAPRVQFNTPTPGATGFPSDGTLQFTITDNQAGINLSSIVVIVNGRTYTTSSPELSYTGSGNSYVFRLTPVGGFFATQINTVVVAGEDQAGNSFTAQMTFNDVGGIGGGGGQGCNCTPAGGVITLPTPDQLFDNTFLDGTVADQLVTSVVSNLGFSGASALLTGAVLSFSLLPYLAFLNAPGLLLNLFAIFIGRRNRKPWGVVIDSVSGEPIPFATCRIFLQGSTSFVTQTVSDPEGRYGFVLTPGNYRLEVLHDKYARFSGNIVIEQGQSTYVYDVRLRSKALADDVGQMLDTRWRRIRETAGNLWKGIKPLLFILGISLSIASVVVLPSIFNFAILALYGIVALAYALNKFNTKPRTAAVIDANTRLRIPGAIVKIFNLEKFTVVDTQITNANGMFDYFGEPGTYAILVTARGYKFPSAHQKEAEFVDYSYAKMLKVKLTKGGNALKIYLDPAGGSEIQTDNLATPFG